MKTIDRLLLKSYSGPMFLTFFIVVFIFVMQFLWMYMDDIAGKGLEWSMILELLFWMALTTIPMALPLSTLLASIMTMGNLGENNELLALKSAGISLQRIMRPLMVLVFVIGILAFYISNNLLPLSNLKMDTLLRDVRSKNPIFALDVGVFSTNLPGFAIKIGNKNSKTSLLHEIMIYDHRAQAGNEMVIVADSGYISVTQNGDYLLTLYDGNMYQDQRNKDGVITDNRPFSHHEFSRKEFLVKAEQWNRTDEEQNKGKMQMLSLADLNKSIDSLKKLQDLEASRTALFYISSSTFSNSTELDTAQVLVNQHTKPINVDSIYNTYDDRTKYNAIGFAIKKLEESKLSMEHMTVEREIKRREIAQGEVEWHMKFTLSVACIIFFFIGAPLGAIIRKGGLGMPMVVSLFLFIIYWVIFSTGKKMAIQGSWNPGFAMWLPTIVLLPLGIFLTYKATSDSSLFSADKYLGWIKKLFRGGSASLSRVDISKVEHVERVSVEEAITDMQKLNHLCREFERDYKLHQGFFSGSNKDEWTMANGQNRLNEISYRYERLIKQLVAMGDNKKMQELLREYPLLNMKNYPLASANTSVAGVVVGSYFVKYRIYRKRKSLKAIFDEIVKVNDLMSNLLLKDE